jgi:hypothetical protein
LGSRFAAYRKTYTMKDEVFDRLLGITLPVEPSESNADMDDTFFKGGQRPRGAGSAERLL